MCTWFTYFVCDNHRDSNPHSLVFDIVRVIRTTLGAGVLDANSLTSVPTRTTIGMAREAVTHHVEATLQLRAVVTPRSASSAQPVSAVSPHKCSRSRPDNIPEQKFVVYIFL